LGGQYSPLRTAEDVGRSSAARDVLDELMMSPYPFLPF
jgi:hypothetical protein